MVKRRIPKATTYEVTPEQLEVFASGADRLPSKKIALDDLDKNANRDFKAIRVPFNEYEYNMLDAGSSKTGRTKLNFIRYAILKLTEEELEKH